MRGVPSNKKMPGINTARPFLHDHATPRSSADKSTTLTVCTTGASTGNET